MVHVQRNVTLMILQTIVSQQMFEVCFRETTQNQSRNKRNLTYALEIGINVTYAQIPRNIDCNCMYETKVQCRLHLDK